MNPEEENNPDLPHKLLSPTAAASSSSEAGMTPLVSQSQPFPSESLAMDDLSFSASPSTPLFHPPLAEFKASITPGGDAAGEESLGLDVPQPMDLQGSMVPPFLSKTYDLVDDPTLDPIISWGPKGESFVVWEPVDFSRIVLPRYFKHSNFSSFVRQLNTYGFRKIDPEKWEFANETFRRGERNLLKNIQRRKSPQSQHVGVYAGPSAEAGKSGLEGEVEILRKERSMMMQEVEELQQQHHGTVQHLGNVNRRLQGAEQRQKQMLSFLAKLFQNPEFLARLRQRKEQGRIASSRMKRRFISHQQNEAGQSESSMEGQIVKYRPDCGDLTLYSKFADENPVFVNPTPDFGLALEGTSFQIEDVAFNELALSNVLANAEGLINATELAGQGTSSLGSEGSRFKGKNVMTPEQEIGPEYFVSFAEDFSVDKDFPEFSSPGIESMVKQEDMWNQGLDASMGMSSSGSELWGNLINYDVPELGSAGLSDIWDLHSVQAAGGSGAAKWPADENPVDEPESQAGQSKDNRSQNPDP